jgi:sugar/nucleoside kinase (ribokinase family)
MNHVLVVGSLALDTLETPFGRVEDAIGGAGVYASSAASFFSPVDLVGVVGDDYPPSALELLRQRRVDVAGVEAVPGGKSFRWSGRYQYDMSAAETLDTQLGVFADFSPTLPDGFRDARYVFLANITPAVQLAVLDQVRAPAFVMADTMNFWIEGARDDLLRVLSRVDMMLLNDAEIRQLTGIPNLARAAHEVLAMGPKYVMVKKGEYGATLVSRESSFNLPCYPLPNVVDPTGAGDTFAGGFIGYLARLGDDGEGQMRCATAIATVMASRCVEAFGLEGLISTTPAEICERYAALRDMVEFGELPPDLV